MKVLLALLTMLIAACQSPGTLKPAPLPPEKMASAVRLQSRFSPLTPRIRLLVEVRVGVGEIVVLGDKNATADAMRKVEAAAATIAGASDLRRIEGTRLLAIVGDQATVAALLSLPEVEDVFEDVPISKSLNRAVPLVNLPGLPVPAPQGSGATVVIIDDGADATHPFFANRVIGGACFAWPNQCPNGQPSQVGVAAGAPCPTCWHGTHVAGIAAGLRTGGTPPRGAAPGAYIYPIQVFNRAGTGATSSDVLAALAHVRDSASLSSFVTSVNMSLGEHGAHDSCVSSPGLMRETNRLVSDLTAAGIAVVVASGNDGLKDKIRWPSCATNAISVGNSVIGASGTTDDGINGSSNASPQLTVVAPGTDIHSSVQGHGYGFATGTSMAAPLVAGGIGALRSGVDWRISDVRASLVNTATPLVDAGNGITYPRVNFQAAWNQLVLSNPASPLVYLKDTPGDTGQEPDSASANRPLYESPDMWVRNAPDGLGHLHQHQNPEAGSPNYIYVRARNRGRAASSGFVVAYYVPSGNAALNSSAWKEIGRSLDLPLPPSNSVVYDVVWTQLPKPGHYCILVKWYPSGTTPTLSFGDMPSAVANDRTLIWRNINIVDLKPGTVAFESGFVLDTSKATNIVLDIDRSLPDGEGWYLEIELPRDAIMSFSEPTLKLMATQISDGNPIRIRVPIKRGTLYLADLKTRSNPGLSEFKFRINRNNDIRPSSIARAVTLRVMEVQDVSRHKGGDEGSIGGVTYRLNH